MRTKLLESSLAFVDPCEVSSSTIVRIAVASLGDWKAAPPVGLESVRLVVSLPSSQLSCVISTVKVLVLSPALNRSVPAVVVKSQRGEATPFAVEHGTKVGDALSSGVA